MKIETIIKGNVLLKALQRVDNAFVSLEKRRIELQKELEELQDPIECMFGFVYAKDTDLHNECDQCSIYQGCRNANPNFKKSKSNKPHD